MIKLTSTNQQILNELYSDVEKAMYWYHKQFCTASKENISRTDSLRKKAMYQLQTVCSDYIEYTSSNNNKWIVFSSARYRKDRPLVNVETNAFCYYETIGSIGIFVPLIDKSNGREVKTCLIFNSHFFYQMSERTGNDCKTKDMLYKFIGELSEINIIKRDTEENRIAIDIKLNSGIGRGFLKFKNNDTQIYEIRTFLKDTQLSKSQKNTVKELYDEKETDLIDIAEKHVKENTNNVEQYSSDDLKELFNLKMNVCSVLQKMGYPSYDDLIVSSCSLKVQKLFKKYAFEDMTYDFRDLVEDVAKLLKYKKFDPLKCDLYSQILLDKNPLRTLSMAV